MHLLHLVIYQQLSFLILHNKSIYHLYRISHCYSKNLKSITYKAVYFSFVRSLGVVARLLAVHAICFQPLSVSRPRLAQCATPLTLGLVLYILRAQLSLWVSLARCLCCGPVVQVEPLAPAICYLRRRLSPQPRCLQSGCDGLSQFKKTQVNPLYPPRI